MYTIDKIIETCNACPSQWSGRTTENEYLYVRYRWGWLRVEVNDQEILSKKCGGPLDGYMDFEELVEHTATLLDFSNVKWVESASEVEDAPA
jgi:hypothetical protein